MKQINKQYVSKVLARGMVLSRMNTHQINPRFTQLLEEE